MDRRTVLAFVLIGVIIILMPYYMRWIQGEPIRPLEPVVDPVLTDAPARDSYRREPSSPPVTPTPPSRVQSPDPVPEPPDTSSIRATFVARDIVVDTDLFRAVFSTRGARVISWKLKSYLTEAGDWLELVGPGGSGLGTVVGGVSADDYEFKASLDRLELSGPEQADLIFTGQTPGGILHKRFRFQGDRYRMHLELSAEGLARGERIELKWDCGLADTEESWNQEGGFYDYTYDQVVTFSGGEVDNWNMERIQGEDHPPSGQLTWLGVRNKYFLSALIPEEGRFVVALSGTAQPSGYQEFHVKLSPESTLSRLGFDVFFGPVSYDILRHQNLNLTGVEREINLDEFIDYGWAFFRPINKPVTILILKSFMAIHELVPNFGVVIVLFSILVKIVVFPLTHKSLESAAKMQQLQPQMQELRERLGDDQQKLNQAMMKLYKDQKINPLGGCLPMVLQMPILISLFTLFRATIELRQAEFALWIYDLSKPDSLLIGGFDVHILPLLMGASMFVQQKMTMKDPKQAALVYIMPIFLTYIFWSMSSGLVFYYTLYNVLTLLQQQIMEKTKSVLGTE